MRKDRRSGWRCAAIAAAGFLAWMSIAVPLWRLPDGLLGEHEFRVQRPLGEPVLITPAKPLVLPSTLFADCELRLAFELTDGAEMDLAVRKVEPRLVEGDLPLFHGRFSVLRFSTRREGPPWRSRDELLFGSDAGGSRTVAGARHELHVREQGRHLRATLDGQRVGEHAAVDMIGDHALVVRGGAGAAARLFELQITPEGTGWSSSLAIVAGIGLVLCSVLAARSLPGLLLLLLGAAAVRWWLFTQFSTWAQPSASGVLLGLAWLLPTALALAAPRRIWIWPAPAVSLAMLAGACFFEGPRIERLADPRLDLHFGPASGAAPFQALARQIEGARGIAGLGDPRPRLLLLGGRPVWEVGELQAMASARLEAAVAGMLGRPLAIACPGTIVANSYQQFALLRGFLLPYRPDAVVFAISAYEAMASETKTARAAAADLRTPSPLAALLPAPAATAPASNPAELASTLDELHALCARERLPLVLATQEGLPEPHLAAVREFAARSSTPLCVAVVTAGGEARIEALARRVTDLLR